MGITTILIESLLRGSEIEKWHVTNSKTYPEDSARIADSRIVRLPWISGRKGNVKQLLVAIILRRICGKIYGFILGLNNWYTYISPLSNLFITPRRVEMR